MEEQEMTILQTRMGRIAVDQDRVVHFPRGLIGFEEMQDFVLLSVRDDSPFLLLQSTSQPDFGILLTDPYQFLKEYQVRIESRYETILQASRREDLAVLVTVSIPEGKPELTTLNLTGPLVINSRLRVGVQVPQVDSRTPTHYEIGKEEL